MLLPCGYCWAISLSKARTRRNHYFKPFICTYKSIFPVARVIIYNCPKTATNPRKPPQIKRPETRPRRNSLNSPQFPRNSPTVPPLPSPLAPSSPLSPCLASTVRKEQLFIFGQVPTASEVSELSRTGQSHGTAEIRRGYPHPHQSGEEETCM